MLKVYQIVIALHGHSVCVVTGFDNILYLQYHVLDIRLIHHTCIAPYSSNVFVMYVRCQWFIILCMSHYWFTHIKGGYGGLSKCAT